ncbi:hypothetical protein DKT68_15270 [Micromonospora acroterricola]|uniref:DUF3168 domain-containing protein n=1 Tax=Micromonospora acroterricola TaxID=2202421 RepID=A0A317D7I0_9ACTN|nr:hypothetical protein [Micromonospora acroterricola]PWR08575.1 hypothetical protein DKT68_15270 [Micromonospora acroterricola]
MSDDPHAVAFLSLLRAVPGLRVFPDEQGNTPTATTALPYVVTWVSVRYDLGPTIDLRSTRGVATATVHSVGLNDTSARITAGKVRDAYLDVVPAIAGRKAFPIRHDDSPPARPDESTGRRVYDQIDVYRLESLPG